MTRGAAVVLLGLWLAASPGADASDDARRLVHLRSGTFDPAVDAPRPARPAAPGLPRLTAAPNRYYLLQLTQAMTSVERRQLAEGGVEILGYIPDRTWLVRLNDPGQAAWIGRRPNARWVGALRPEDRIEPGLPGVADAGGFDVTLFAGESATALIEALAREFPRVRLLHHSRREPQRLTLDVAGDPGDTLDALSRYPGVAWIERHRPLAWHNDQSVWIGQSYDRILGPVEAAAAAPATYAQSATAWQHGLTGAGQVIGIADTGLEYGSCFFDDPDVPLVPQTVAPPQPLLLEPAHRKVLALNDANGSGFQHDGSFRHGTHVSGTVAGDDLAAPASGAFAGHDPGDGMAPAAKIVFEDVSLARNSQCSTSIFVPSIGDLLEQEYLAGARLANNSFGSGSGSYTASSAEVDALLWHRDDLAVFFSAGNGGSGGLTSFAASKNAIAVGAVETFKPEMGFDPENLAAFSSRGPTADGRIKPDLVAPGVWVISNRFPTLYIDDENDPRCDAQDPDVCRPSFGGCYVTTTSQSCTTSLLSGTSMASPTVTGLAALVRQYLVEGFYPGGARNAADALVPSAALLKALLVNGARNLEGLDRAGGGPLLDAPSGKQGWGRVHLDDALYFAGDARRLFLVDRRGAAGLATAESATFVLVVHSGAEPLKLTLAWTDPPALPFASVTLVDDLDLELIAPDGTLYAGNRWTADDPQAIGDRASAADPPDRDDRNNVEGILLRDPPPGEYLVRVRGREVPGHQGATAQGFALVASADLSGVVCAALPAPGISLQEVDSTRVTLNIDPVPGAASYELFRGPACSATPPASPWTAETATAGSHVVSGLPPATAIEFRARSVAAAAACPTAIGPCVGATTLPAPPTLTGLHATRADAAIELTWDNGSCPAAAVHLLYGDLADVAALEPQGASCAVGQAGQATWSDAPAGDLWFLLVAGSGVATEGGWGADSSGAARRAGQPSGFCGASTRIEAICP